MVKPGYRTSEFWFTLVSFIFSGAYLLGLLESTNQKDDLIGETSKGLEALILIMGQLAVLFRYVKGRTEIKKVWWNTVSSEERKIADERNNKGRTKNVKPRTNKKRSRKTNS
jgi:hypothetical protein